jgi:hypothetical protein
MTRTESDSVMIPIASLTLARRLELRASGDGLRLDSASPARGGSESDSPTAGHWPLTRSRSGGGPSRAGESSLRQAGALAGELWRQPP